MNTLLPGGRVTGWLIKYKLHHILFWCVYHYFWWTVTVANPVKAASAIFSTPLFIKYAFYVIFQAIAVYANLYWLMPKYLEKNRYYSYVALLAGIILSTSVCIVSGHYLAAIVSHKTVSELFGQGTCFFFFFGSALPSTVASSTLAMCLKLLADGIANRQRQQLAEKEKLEAELQFLKYQFNPHFLFNSINAIFFLINTNPKVASASLSKFSELLRHQLYDCNDQLIPLGKEISYLENFISLEKLRRKNLEVLFEVNEQHTNHVMIAPFILMTFVENAFKHSSRFKNAPNTINIQLILSGDNLQVMVSNTIAPQDKHPDVLHYGGIGLQNVQRRLELLYANRHTLTIEKTGTHFTVHLQLTLAERIVQEMQAAQPNLFATPNEYTHA